MSDNAEQTTEQISADDPAVQPPMENRDEILTLAGDFDQPDLSQWEAEVLKVMNRRRPPGKELDIAAAMAALRTTTVEGIDIEPLYCADGDVAPLGHPGQMPFVRGTTVHAGGMDAWDIRQLHEDPDVGESRRRVLADLERGATSVWVRTGPDAVPVDKLGEVLGEVMVDLAPVAVSSHDDQRAAAQALIDVWVSKEATKPSGNLGLDALALAARGLDADLTSHHDWVRRCLADLPGVRALTVDVLGHHEAGASDVDELGLAVATGVEYLRDLEAAGISPSDAFGQIDFRVSATADQFLTIARLRALRRLWARVGEVCGVPEDQRGARQHAVTSWRMMTRDDPWVNMLRTTIACFAASVGGAEEITVLPFDSVHGLPNDFSRRIARNTQVILAEESNIGRVNDPAGGSWYVEALTDALAEKAWEFFGRIEADGGLQASLRGSLVADQLAASVAERDKRLAHRKAPLTGVSTFPNPTEPSLERKPRPASPITGKGLQRRRDAEIFEAMRDRSSAHLAATGERPKVFLATVGLRRDYGARETFTSALLGVAGLECPFVEGADPAEMAQGLRDAKTTVAVLCSSTKMYAEHGAEIIRALRDAGATKVLLAGRDKELGDEAGLIDGTLYDGVDAVALLNDIQDHLGLEPGMTEHDLTDSAQSPTQQEGATR